MKKIPYVVSEDIRTISRFGDYVVKDIIAKYISQSIKLHCEKYITRNTIMLYEKEITDWVTKTAPHDVVIQSSAYTENIKSPFVLHITRAISEQFHKMPTRAPRQGYPALEIQMINLGLFNQHTLLDDVVYSGQSCKEIIDIGKKQNVLFDKVIACVTIGAGKQKLESIGVSVSSLYYFESVIDEICQRDFLPGLPFARRTLVTKEGNYRYLPYLLPWGNPKEWATVPEKNIVNFSKACISTAIEFWEEVYPSVRFFEVPGIVYDPKINSTNLRFMDYLHQCYKAL